MRNLKGAKSFPTMVEKLCLKYLSTFARYPQTDMVEGKCNLVGLNRTRTLHQNKEEEHHQKAQRQQSDIDDDANTSPPLTSEVKFDPTKDDQPIKNPL
uniref:Uncharacterized protein n=1 Tax=Cucumis melo TaxID=3656 RepID=A0A9I9DIT8_CUCME